MRNLAVEKDFYQLRDVSKETLDFLRQLANASEFESGRKINRTWIYICTAVFFYKTHGLQAGISDPEFWRQIDSLIHNTEEDLQMRLENIGGKFLDRMLVGDTKFFEEYDTCIEFCFYLATQMLRTKKTRDIMRSFTAHQGPPELGECWYIAARIFATNFGATLFRDRKTYSLVILNNVSDSPLITTDQPVFNFRELASKSDQLPDSIYMVYPLSPVKLMLLVPKTWASQRVSRTLQNDEVQRFNARLVAQSHEQVFATSEKSLQLYRRAVGS